MEMVAQVNRTLSADQPPLTMETFRRLYGINDEMRKDRALVQKTCVMVGIVPFMTYLGIAEFRIFLKLRQFSTPFLK